MYNKEGWLRLDGMRFGWFFVGFRWFLFFRICSDMLSNIQP